MAQLGTLGGLNALGRGVDRVAESQRNLNALQNVEQNVQKQKAESILMQQMEAKQYEELQNKASELLERDRVAINKKSLDLQMNVRAKIEEYGSRKAFFAAGGQAFLSEYKNNLLTSDEFTLYKDNKANMTNILRVQEAGKSLNRVDEMNLINYNNGTSNKITYTGIKNAEIEIPSNEYDYGTVIPPQVILHKGSNYMKIKGNFLLDHPEMKDLSGEKLEEQLQYYTLREHGGNRGLDHTRERQEAAQRQLDQKNATSVKSENNPHGLTNRMVNGLNQMGNFTAAPLTLDNVMSSGYIEKLDKASGGNYNKLFGDAYTETGTKAKSSMWSTDGWDTLGQGINKFFGNETTFQLANARKAFPLSTLKLTKTFYGDASEDGKIIFKPNTSDCYQANGDKLTKNNTAIEDTSASVEGYVFAPYDSGTGKMITIPLNHDGKPYSDGDKKYKDIMAEHKKLYTGTPQYSMFAVLKNSEGETIYQKQDVTKWEGLNTVSAALGKEVNDMNPMLQENQERDNIVAKKRQQLETEKEEIKFFHEKARSAKGVFSSPEAIQESTSLQYGNDDRTDLYQAYQMASADMYGGGLNNESVMHGIKTRGFTNAIDAYPKLKNAILNKKAYSDIAFMDIFAKEISGNDAEDIQENDAFNQIWKQYYNLIQSK